MPSQVSQRTDRDLLWYMCASLELHKQRHGHSDTHGSLLRSYEEGDHHHACHHHDPHRNGCSCSFSHQCLAGKPTATASSSQCATPHLQPKDTRPLANGVEYDYSRHWQPRADRSRVRVGENLHHNPNRNGGFSRQFHWKSDHISAHTERRCGLSHTSIDRFPLTMFLCQQCLALYITCGFVVCTSTCPSRAQGAMITAPPLQCLSAKFLSNCDSWPAPRPRSMARASMLEMDLTIYDSTRLFAAIGVGIVTNKDATSGAPRSQWFHSQQRLTSRWSPETTRCRHSVGLNLARARCGHRRTLRAPTSRQCLLKPL